MRKHSMKTAGGFTLLELLLTILILGALTAIMLPTFDYTEKEALDTADYYNMAVTIRTVAQYKSANGVYPTSLHTGVEACTEFTSLGTGTLNAGDWVPAAMAYNCYRAGVGAVGAGGVTISSSDLESDPYWIVKYNTAAGELDNWSTGAGAGSSAIGSLVKAGINQLVYGDGSVTVDLLGFTTANRDVFTIPLSETAGQVTTGFRVGDSGLSVYATTDNYTTTINGKDSSGWNETGNVLIPLFVTPEAEWENWYTSIDGSTTDESGASRIGGMVGRDPHIDRKAFGYYMLVFDVDNGKTFRNLAQPARLVGILSPQFISLNP